MPAKGQRISEETRERMRAAVRKRGQDPNYIRKMKVSVAIRNQNPEYHMKLRAGVAKRAENQTWYSNICKRNETVAKDPNFLRLLKGKLAGDKNPSWKGGVAYLPYCQKFNQPRRKAVREFFNNFCICCGSHSSEIRKALHVHHIDHDKEQGCNGKPFNLVPLCPICHNRELNRIMDYRGYINRTLEEGFKWGIWSRERYAIEVMYPE